MERLAKNCGDLRATECGWMHTPETTGSRADFQPHSESTPGVRKNRGELGQHFAPPNDVAHSKFALRECAAYELRHSHRYIYKG